MEHLSVRGAQRKKHTCEQEGIFSSSDPRGWRGQKIGYDKRKLAGRFIKMYEFYFRQLQQPKI